MNLLLACFIKEFPFWNKRAFTMDDFYRYCRRKRIKIHEMPMKTAAMFGVKYGRPHISVLDEGTLTGIISRGDLHDYPRDVLKRRLRMVEQHGC